MARLPSAVAVCVLVLVTLTGLRVVFLTERVSAIAAAAADSPHHAAADQRSSPPDPARIRNDHNHNCTKGKPAAERAAAAAEIPLGGKFEPVLPDGRRRDAPPSAPVVPLIWHVPKSGGTSLKAFVSCLNVTIAAEGGRYRFTGTGSGSARTTANRRRSLEVLSRPGGGGPFVNVDVSSREGIREAHRLGFVEEFVRRQAGETRDDDLVVVTSFVHSAARWLFPEGDESGAESDGAIEPGRRRADEPSRSRGPIKGLLLTVLRHPIDRATSLFHYLKYAAHESTYHPEWQNLSSISEWEDAEDNWMVRFLSGVGELGGHDASRPLTNDDLHRAKAILSNYTVIGLTERMGESLDRFGAYLGWDRRLQEGGRWRECRAKFGNSRHNSASHPYEPIRSNTTEWHHLMERNRLDLELYRHAVNLFRYQGEVLFGLNQTHDRLRESNQLHK